MSEYDSENHSEGELSDEDAQYNGNTEKLNSMYFLSLLIKMLFKLWKPS